MGWMAPLRHLGAKMPVGQKPPANREPSMNEITTIGLDLAKHVFQVHGVDAAGATVLRKQLRRAGHLTASDLYAAGQIISCQAGAIHT